MRMNVTVELSQIRFLGRHRCPRCRMPLYAEELSCPVCMLEIVFLDARGEVMVQMVSVEDLQDYDNADVQEYWTMMTVESTGELYMSARPLPTRPQHADLQRLPDGMFGVRYANRVALEDVKRG